MSVRLSAELQMRLERAASSEGMTASELVRQAVAERCDAILGSTLDVRLADVVGSVRSRGRKGGWSAVSDEELSALIKEDDDRRRRRV